MIAHFEAIMSIVPISGHTVHLSVLLPIIWWLVMKIREKVLIFVWVINVLTNKDLSFLLVSVELDALAN